MSLLHLVHPALIFVLAATTLLTGAHDLQAAAEVVTAPRLIDNFESGLSPSWEAKSFRGKTRYEVVPEGDGRVLRAESRASASGLVQKFEFDPRQYPVLSWRWKVNGIVRGGDARTKTGDDYAARLYVVFPHWFPPMTKTLNYIWANRLPKGTFAKSPFWGGDVMIAVESGDKRAGTWVEERRNLVEDYRKAFGADPPKAGAIALMTDTDQTGETAVGWYDDLRLEPDVTAPSAPGTGSGSASR